MKRITYFLILLYLGISLSACSQKKESTINQNQNITADDLVEEIAKQVKHYSSEKIYGINYNVSLCRFDIYVNGIMIHKNFGDGMGSTGVQINEAIFKSGIQHFTFKLYPLFHYQKSEYEPKLFYKTLTKDTDFEADINSYDKKRENESEITYKEYELPKVEKEVTETEAENKEWGSHHSTTKYKEKRFIGEGKTYYEINFDVNLEVPYTISPPFKNAQDLTKLDSKKLEKMIVKKYNQIKIMYENRDLDNLARIYYDRAKVKSISNFIEKKDIEEEWNSFKTFINKNDLNIELLENYEIRYLADGKLITLVKKAKDISERNKSAFLGIKNNSEKTEIELQYFFYIPQGETEFKVY